MSRWARRRQRVVGNGVDLSRFVPAPAARDAVRAKLGLDDRTVLVGGVGRVTTEKGVREFAEVARELSGDDVRFVWVGPSDGEDGATGYRFSEEVGYLGEWADMPGLYNALDVFVLPSYREGFSRAGMEAAAVGKPLVLSDIRGCRELGQHDKELLLVPVGDVQSLRAAVRSLVENADLRARLGSAARRRAVEEFDQVRVAATSLRTYAAVAARRGLGWTLKEVETA